MTRLTIAEDPGEEFAIRGHNTVTDADEDGIIFYDDVTKVDVLPEPGNFTIQIITPDLAVEMDFADADGVREALELFEAKKVLEVSLEAPNSVRIIPSLKNEGTLGSTSTTSAVCARQLHRTSKFPFGISTRWQRLPKLSVYSTTGACGSKAYSS